MENTNLSATEIFTLAPELKRHYSDLMVDLETLGTAPNAVITEVALVPFNRASQGDHATKSESLVMRLNCEEQERRGRRTYVGTLLWWLERDPDYISNALQGGLALDMATRNIATYISGVNPARIWAKSPTFDLNIIRNLLAYNSEHGIPWSYKQERDVRNSDDLSKLLPDNTIVRAHHDAYKDCLAQIVHVQMEWHLLKAGVQNAEWV